MTKPAGHSELGASGTHRWMECPGSVQLSRGIEDPESEHAAIGTAAHALGEVCLCQGADAWTFIGHHIVDGKTWYPPKVWKPEIGGIEITKTLADPVQVYVAAVRETHPERHQGNTWIERDFHCPDIHPLFYGTSDCIHWDEAEATLHVWDYKNGAGIVVEVDDNPQLKYYAIGALEDLGLWNVAKRVVLHVAQPNGFHSDGPIRQWETTPAELDEWCFDVLVPAMDRALVSRDTKSGEHCRFCPARRMACPQLEKDMEELEAMMSQINEETGAKPMSNDQLGRFLGLFELAKIKAKAVNEEAFNRMNAGAKVPGFKLVAGRANRQFKEGAEAAAKEKFGDRALTPRELKSPAEIDKLPEGKTFTAQWAFKPDVGLTVAKDEDQRTAVNKDKKSMFKPVPKGRKTA